MNRIKLNKILGLFLRIIIIVHINAHIIVIFTFFVTDSGSLLNRNSLVNVTLLCADRVLCLVRAAGKITEPLVSFCSLSPFFLCYMPNFKCCLFKLVSKCKKVFIFGNGI